MEGVTEVGMHEAKTRLSQLVELARSGEEVIITKRGEPVVRLEPVRAPGAGLAAVRGRYKGQVWMSEDWDEDLPADLELD